MRSPAATATTALGGSTWPEPGLSWRHEARTTVRAAFRVAVDCAVLPGEDDSLGGDLELEEYVDHVMGRLTEAGQTFILVPARARRIDERVARILGELPVELAELDRNIEPTPMTPQDAAPAAVTATLGGTLSVQEIGDLLRGMNPGMAAHLFAPSPSSAAYI